MASVIPQPTPNPAAYKFTIQGHRFDRAVTIKDAASAEGTPFEPLFLLPGVASVFATADFVTVTKRPEADWSELAGPARKALESSF
jgi:hypothetical protein